MFYTFDVLWIWTNCEKEKFTCVFTRKQKSYCKIVPLYNHYWSKNNKNQHVVDKKKNNLKGHFIAHSNHIRNYINISWKLRHFLSRNFGKKNMEWNFEHVPIEHNDASYFPFSYVCLYIKLQFIAAFFGFNLNTMCSCFLLLLKYSISCIPICVFMVKNEQLICVKFGQHFNGGSGGEL